MALIPLLTLDTMCVSYLTMGSSHLAPCDQRALDALYRAVSVGVVELQVTPSQLRDTARMKNAVCRSERERWLSNAPVLVAPGVARFDASTFDGGDTFASAEQLRLEQRLHELLKGGAAREGSEVEAVAKAWSDVDHLLGHWTSKAEAFLTDDRDMLRKEQSLAELGIRVLLPSTAEERYL